MTVHDDLATLRSHTPEYDGHDVEFTAALDRVEAEIARLEQQLRECGDSFAEVERVASRCVAAEARCARLRDGLERWFGPDGTWHPPLDVLNERALREVDAALRALLAEDGAA